jgi:hypothetical protein
VAWTSLNKELLWPYTSSNGTCTSTIYGALSGLAVKLSSGAAAVYPSLDETAFKTVSRNNSDEHGIRNPVLCAPYFIF